MELNTITSIIGTLGFPIAVCIACFWFINKTLKELKDAMTSNTTATHDLINKIADLIKSFKEDK